MRARRKERRLVLFCIRLVCIGLGSYGRRSLIGFGRRGWGDGMTWRRGMDSDTKEYLNDAREIHENHWSLALSTSETCCLRSVLVNVRAGIGKARLEEIQ